MNLEEQSNSERKSSSSINSKDGLLSSRSTRVKGFIPNGTSNSRRYNRNEKEMAKFTRKFINCIKKLQELGNIDSRVDEIREEIAQSNIHLQNTSKYLTLDICVQSHTRDRSATCYIKNDMAELPLIIFDKDNVITFKDNYELNLDLIKKIFENNKYRIKQKSRVEKYIKRNQYLEAYMKYIENIAEPLVVISRLIYTPRHYYYKLCHITNHLPKDEVNKLEPLFKVSSFKDIENNLNIAENLLYENEKYFI